MMNAVTVQLAVTPNVKMKMADIGVNVLKGIFCQEITVHVKVC